MTKTAAKTQKEKIAEEMLDRTPIGTLRVIKIYAIHDNGALLSCRNNSGQIFIAKLVEYDKKRSGNPTKKNVVFERWHYIPVTEEALNEFEAGRVSLYGVMEGAECDWIYEVSKESGYIYNARRRMLREIQLQDLPAKESYIDSIELSFVDTAKKVQAKVTTITNEYGAENYNRDSGEDNFSATV